MTMNLSVSDFRAVGDSAGNAALHTNQEHSAFVQGEKGAWIKSLLNIGGAREANANTINALRQAVFHDPQYAKVTGQACALLGRLSTSTPLTGKQVSKFLGQLDAAAAKADAQMIDQNKTLVSQTAMRVMSNIDRYASEAVGDEGFSLSPGDLFSGNSVGRFEGKEGFHLSPGDKSMLISLISDRLMARAGDFRKPLNEQQIQAIVRDAASAFAALQDRLDKVDLPPNIKNIIKGEFLQNGAFISLKELDGMIQTRLNVRANDALQEESKEFLLRNFDLAMERLGGLTLPEMTDKAKAGLAEAVGAAIEKAGQMGGRMVSRKEAETIIEAQVKTLADAYKNIKNVGDTRQVAFMRELVMSSPVPISEPYLRALMERARDIPPETFTALGQASSPKQFLEVVEKLGKLVEIGFNSLDKSLKLEGAGGQQSFVRHCLGLAIAGAVGKDSAQALFKSLTSPLGQEMRAMFAFASGSDPFMASNGFTLNRLTEALGRLAGRDDRAIDAVIDSVFGQIPESADEFSPEVRALLPGYQPA